MSITIAALKMQIVVDCVRIAPHQAPRGFNCHNASLGPSIACTTFSAKLQAL
jgi:hypothetical protein